MRPRGASRFGQAPPSGRRSRWTERSDRYLRADRADHPRGGRLIALIVDAGPLYAYVDGDDTHHATSLELLETHPGPLIIPTLVLTEVSYLVSTRLGWQPEVRLLGDLAAGNFALEPVQPEDLIRIAELVAKYHDLPLGTVDASVVATAERLRITEIATVDRRHFGVVRPAHIDVFHLLP